MIYCGEKAIAQTLFILDASRRNTFSADQQQRKPGREVVTFLLVYLSSYILFHLFLHCFLSFIDYFFSFIHSLQLERVVLPFLGSADTEPSDLVRMEAVKVIYKQQ